MATGWKRFTGSSPYPVLSSSNNGTVSTYGSKQDRSYRIPWLQGKHSRNDEIQMLAWISEVTGEAISQDRDTALEQLHDGRILCRLLQRLSGGAVCRTINEKPSPFGASENIARFFESLAYFDIKGPTYISPNELLEERNMDGLISLLENLYRRSR
ncbi:hypothetical protein ANCCAN_01817 [Ancylostoma caninum]|uniref:Calponin-homology (CH) domain-containing protein n=1 Tax=Ancylostoma caninum TaxID=29170 RepID=A0A368H8S9_ANCCA|nr:hypothetical protein ANCCAN_01817 [Ancylostoma caninum]